MHAYIHTNGQVYMHCYIRTCTIRKSTHADMDRYTCTYMYKWAVRSLKPYYKAVLSVGAAISKEVVAFGEGGATALASAAVECSGFCRSKMLLKDSASKDAKASPHGIRL